MATTYIALGSNLGDCQQNLIIALQNISSLGVISQQSCPIWTEPQYRHDQPAFLNQVIQVETDLTPRELLHKLKEIEKDMGRQTTFRYGPRLIDLDILYYDQQVIYTKELQIPHSEIPNRDFVLYPLAEIAPNFRCPSSGKTIQEMADVLRHLK